jgi:hypothetical protein
MTLLRFSRFNHHKGQEEAHNTHAHTQKKNIGYRKPDRIKVRGPHSMTEIQGQRPKDCVLAGKRHWSNQSGLEELAPEERTKNNKTDLGP